jgi:hypothetical protein
MNIAILDDYQNVASEIRDWSALSGEGRDHSFNDHSAPEEISSSTFGTFVGFQREENS